MDTNLTVTDLLALFGRAADDSRWVSAADSNEYLANCTYLVERSQGRLPL